MVSKAIGVGQRGAEREVRKKGEKEYKLKGKMRMESFFSFSIFTAQYIKK